ncbi:MAG: hypothetical protein Q9213_006461 [Squamulea squamosa]
MASPFVPHRHPELLSCKDPKTGIAQKCWDELKVGSYMLDWAKKNFPSTCKKGEDFSTCCNRFAAPANGPQDCTSLASEDSIHEFIVNWANATKYVATRNPSTIKIAATPEDIFGFIAARDNGTLKIDVALSGLITKGLIETPQRDMLHTTITSYAPKSNLAYNSNKIETASVAELIVKRLDEVLTFDRVLAMAESGTFSTPEVVSEAILVKTWWPEAGEIASSCDGVEEAVEEA